MLLSAWPSAEAPAADNDDDSNVDLFGTEEEKKAEERAAKVKSSCKKKESLSSSLHDGVVSRRVMDSLTRRKLFSATPATSVQAFGSMAPPVNKLLREEGCGRACRVKGKSDTLLGVLQDFHSDSEKFQRPSELLLLVMSADELSLHCSRSIQM